MIKCSDELIDNKEYFDNLTTYIKQPESIEAVYYYLLNYDYTI